MSSDVGSDARERVVVIGAGVIGLTTAVRIQETGRYDVNIVAEHFHSDTKKTVEYTSYWAGAHHVGFPDDTSRQQQLDRETFETMWAMCEPNASSAHCFVRVSQDEYYTAEKPAPHVLSWMPDFTFLPDSALPQDTRYGISFTTLTIDPTQYLPYLHDRFLKAGGTVTRGQVSNVSDVARGELPGSQTDQRAAAPHAVVVCAGLGARTLGGVEDSTIYPVRGQTVILRAPWVTFGRTMDRLGRRTPYVIPRANGDLVVGGTREANDWHPSPRPETTEKILREALVLVPELVPPEERDTLTDPEQRYQKVRSLVVEEGCGRRPARKDGIRLAAEEIAGVAVVHNYGQVSHGGGGFQSSWGSANVALQLLEGSLSKGEVNHQCLNDWAAGYDGSIITI